MLCHKLASLLSSQVCKWIAVSLRFLDKKFHTEFAQPLQQSFGGQGSQGEGKVWSGGSNLSQRLYGSADLAHFSLRENFFVFKLFSYDRVNTNEKWNWHHRVSCLCHCLCLCKVSSSFLSSSS